LEVRWGGDPREKLSHGEIAILSNQADSSDLKLPYTLAETSIGPSSMH